MAQNNSYINPVLNHEAYSNLESIDLDALQKQMDDELRKAKARRDAEMIAKANEDYENLMKFNYTQDPRNQRVEMKPRKEYTHFEDTMPSGEELMGLLDNPEAVKILAEQYRNKASKNIADKEAKAIAEGESNIGKYTDPLSREDRKAISSENMFGYRPSNFKVEYPRPKEEEPDVDEELAKAASFNAIDSMKRAHARDVHGKPINPSGIIAYQTDNPYAPESTVQDNNTKNIEETKVEQKPEEPKEEEQFYLKYITPQVNEALKAIADKDPSMLQLPEVKALMERSKIAYGKQNDLLSIAPWTSNPDQTVQVANALREQGDKNLMDAAANLESIRTRQLDATKAMADDLTRQKGNLAGFGSSVLNMQGNALMQLPVTYEGARQSNEEANKIHDIGDAKLKAAKSSLYDFITSATEAMIKPYSKDKAAATAIIDDIMATINTAEGASESAWYDRIDPETKVKHEGLLTKLGNLKKHLNANSQPELTAIIKGILDNLADYKSAMATEQQHRATAFNAAMRGNQIFNTVAEVGQKFKMPLTGIDPSLDFKYPGGLDNSKSKSSSNGNSNTEDQSNGDSIIKEDQKTGKRDKKPKGDPIKDEEIKLSKAENLYVNGIKLLNDYKRAAEKAANARAGLKTNNTTQAAVDLAEGVMLEKRNDASDFIQDLLTAASNGNDTARVVLGAIYQSRYSPQLDTLGSNGIKIMSSGNVKYRNTKDKPNAILNAQSEAIQEELKKSGLLGYFQ